MQALPGFRDFLPDDCAARNYVFARWRAVARRYGFVEYDGPMLEPMELYQKKSGGELVGQLFDFTDKGERQVALRPEMTPTLARMVAARARDFRKPLKWFSIGQFFRYEKQQRGRLREFYQLNCDIFGEQGPGADAETIALAIDLLRAFGLTEKDFVVRVSDRRAWMAFLRTKAPSLSAVDAQEFLTVIDKIDPKKKDATRSGLQKFNISIEEVQTFIAAPEEHFGEFRLIADNLRARGLAGYFEIDPGIVRGLAYYTGVVFEIFDRGGKLRAIAGGGRYDDLVHQLSDGATSLPALGFAMGDVVLGELLAESASAREKRDATMKSERALDLYVVIAKEVRRPEALAGLQEFRDAGFRVDYSLSEAKVGKQFQTAEALGAKFTILYGDEWPLIKVKTLATREEILLPNEQIFARVSELLGAR